MSVSVYGFYAPVKNVLGTRGDLVAFPDPNLCASRLTLFRRIEIESGEPRPAVSG